MHMKTLGVNGFLLCLILTVGTTVHADHNWQRELRHQRDVRLRELEHWYRQEREAIDHAYRQKEYSVEEQMRRVARLRHPHRHAHIRQLDHERDRMEDQKRWMRKSLEQQYAHERDRLRHEYKTAKDAYEGGSGPGAICPSCGLLYCDRQHHEFALPERLIPSLEYPDPLAYDEGALRAPRHPAGRFPLRSFEARPE